MAAQRWVPESPSSLKLPMRWLHLLTRITYRSKLIGIRSFAAFLQLQCFWVD